MKALSRLGFSELRFVPAGLGRTADAVGEFGGLRWAVELRASSRPLREDATFEPAGPEPLPYPTLESYFALLWREKSAQLAATMAAERCARGLLLVSVEAAGGVAEAAAAGGAWERALARAYEEAKQPPATRFALLRGPRLVSYPALD